MASRDLEREIDKLYRLPLDEFTSARNALAKTAGTDGASVKGLQKPPIAAWAVNPRIGITQGARLRIVFAKEDGNISCEFDVLDVKTVDALQYIQWGIRFRYQGVKSSLQTAHKHARRNSVSAHIGHY